MAKECAGAGPHSEHIQRAEPIIILLYAASNPCPDHKHTQTSDYTMEGGWHTTNRHSYQHPPPLHTKITCHCYRERCRTTCTSHCLRCLWQQPIILQSPVLTHWLLDHGVVIRSIFRINSLQKGPGFFMSLEGRMTVINWLGSWPCDLLNITAAILLQHVL